MKDRLAVVAYVFGDSYQSFAPLYAHSVIKTYPEYTVLLYFDRKISETVRRRLEYLSTMGDVRYREEYDFGMPKQGPASRASNVMRAGRWLFRDEWFKEFRWVYIGDVDILIVREEIALLQGHRAHAQHLSLPYSNVVRLTADARVLTPGALKVLWKARDSETFRRRLRGEVIARNRLTGLHFVEQAPYFDAVSPLFESRKKAILLDTPDVRSRDDEEILYSLIEDSGLPMPPVSATGPDLDCTRFESVNYRPHHGVHLGIFRTSGSIQRQRQTLQSYVYRDHFEGYRALRADPTHQDIRRESNSYVSGLLEAVDRYISD